MNILYISSFADPNPVNSNHTSISVVSSLLESGIKVKMMTCHHDPTWQGELPTCDFLIGGQPVLETTRSGIPYVMTKLPKIWYERYLTHEEWNDAVQWGVELLNFLKPDIVHLQQWQNLWWMLASAQKLNIPTVYSVNDYGMICQRTMLITSNGIPCSGPTSISKCVQCTFKGRSLVGKFNELVAYIPGSFALLNLGFQSGKHRIMRLSLKRRIRNNFERSFKVLNRCSAIIVGSPFGIDVVSLSGAQVEKIHIAPWFHDQKDFCLPLKGELDNLTFGFIGRISPEKGLHILLAALEQVHLDKPLTLRIAGGIQGDYAEGLHKKYRYKAGNNNIEWIGWIANSDLKQFYSSIQMTVIPSIAMETGPLSLVESLFHRRPVLCSDLAPMQWTNKLFGSGWSFPCADINALAEKIKILSINKKLFIDASSKIKEPPSRANYINKVIEIYNGLT
jgi:glycosyltransferase involved in cell wall biosynthesis